MTAQHPSGRMALRARQSEPARVMNLLLTAALFAVSALSYAGDERLSLSSRAFTSMATIPSKYTCDGDDVSPSLSWSAVPSSTRSLALIVDDPDAPDPEAPTMTWVHWVLYNLPGGSGALQEAVSQESLPAGTLEGRNDWQRTGYGGPCPPVGRHRYYFKLYALDTVLPDLRHPSKAELLHALEGHVLAEARLIGTYGRGSLRQQLRDDGSG